MSRQVSPSTDRVYGLQRVTRIWSVSRATVYRHRQQPEAIARRRPGPLGAMADEALVRAIRQLLQDSPFHGEGYRKLWARLRFAGIRTSRRRVLRLMRENGLLAHQRAGRPHGSRAHDGTITTERVDLMWGTDLTSVMTGEGQAALQRAYASCAHGHAAVIAVDHCSTECVGIHASRSADRFQALEPVKQAVRQCHGGFATGIAAGLRLRHDHGSQYVSHDFQAEIRFLGIPSSPAFVREPEGNGCAERFIRVLKENLLWVRRFDTIEELRLALLAFRQTYNQSWIIERHGYRTPAQVRAERATALPMAA
jgi:transposase InsO family protein